MKITVCWKCDAWTCTTTGIVPPDKIPTPIVGRCSKFDLLSWPTDSCRDLEGFCQQVIRHRPLRSITQALTIIFAALILLAPTAALAKGGHHGGGHHHHHHKPIGTPAHVNIPGPAAHTIINGGGTTLGCTLDNSLSDGLITPSGMELMNTINQHLQSKKYGPLPH